MGTLPRVFQTSGKKIAKEALGSFAAVHSAWSAKATVHGSLPITITAWSKVTIGLACEHLGPPSAHRGSRPSEEAWVALMARKRTWASCRTTAAPGPPKDATVEL